MKPAWHKSLTAKDWLFDGRPIRGKETLAMFGRLDWAKSYIDLGPSPLGNLGPYWHVPLRKTVVGGKTIADGDTTHRLYPKLLTTKWAPMLRELVKASKRKVNDG
ncbi:MAG: hypothetical protein KGL39_06245 [Patescibacteria group bacterium]|nr:hypothetical protein [Patescibacteria group bacterium]